MEGFAMLKHFRVVRAVLLIAVGSCHWAVSAEPARPARDEVQGTLHTVEAGVGYSTNSGTGIQADRRPGEFTVPKGSQATKLKYSFADPKLDYTSTKLRGSNIYSVTEKRYMHELDKDPNFELPPGDYRFVVGGSPGATGTLSYTAVPSSGTSLPPKPPGGPKSPPGHSAPPAGFPKPGGEEVLLNLPRDFDVAAPGLSLYDAEKAKTPITLRFRGQTVTCTYNHTQPPSTDSFPSQIHGTFTMSGTFYRGQLTGSANYVYFNRDTRQGIDFHQGKYEVQIQGQANADGALTITSKWKPTNMQTRVPDGPVRGDSPLPYGAWKDITQEYQSKGWIKPIDKRFTVQLPVGQLQSSQKLTPE